MEIVITVPGEAVPQARPRVTHCGTYDPPKCRAYKQKVALYAKTVMRGKKPLSGALNLDVVVYRSIPKSWTKKRRFAAAAGDVDPTTKPDIDNLLKGLMDAMSGIVWNDDSQVVNVMAEKVYDTKPRAVVKVSTREDISND